MDTITKTEAVKRLERAGMRVSVFGDTIYADYQCNHCSSITKVGELEAVDERVGILALERIIKDYETSS